MYHPDTLPALLETGAAADVALRVPNAAPISHGQLRSAVVAIGAQLAQLGIGRETRVALVMPNGPEIALAFLGVAAAATAAPLNPKYRADEFAFSYQDTNATALITLPGNAAAAEAALLPGMQLIHATLVDGTLQLHRVSGTAEPVAITSATPDAIALVLHTSGTTSRPKSVPIRQRNLAASARNIISTYQLGPHDAGLCVMPLFHIHGLIAALLSPIAAGGAAIVPPGGFDALRFFGWLRDERPTWYSAVPTMHQLLLTRAERNADAIAASPLRFIRSSSAPLPPVVLERLEATFGAPVLESYGMTEATHQMAANPLPPLPHKSGAVGYGFGVELAILDEAGTQLARGTRGEVAVRGPNVIDGYENNPTANATAFVNGWFRTGDQGYLDEDGYLVLTGRLKELINRGGEKISPLEIDDLLLRHPAVAEALAFAVPHKTLGEDIAAAVVLRPDASASAAELRAYCASSLAEFKVPRTIYLLAELPRGATGKLQRINMAQILGVGPA